ncbi:MAG: hypothetical protein ABI811_20730 [Acidobacteriota bacterium]
MRHKLLLIATLAGTTAWAQDIVSARAGLIHYMEGEVRVNNVLVEQTGDQFLSMKQGDTLSTSEGRAEILLNAGTYLRIGDGSSFRLDSADLGDTRLAVLSGTMIVEVADLPKDTAVTLALNGSNIALRKRGLYEFSAGAAGNIRVYDGELALNASNALPIKVSKGREIAFNALSAGPGKFDIEDTTELYNWSARRARYVAQANQAAALALYNGGSRPTTSSSLIPMGGYGGVWLWNSFYGMYTYLPTRGYGYSPYGIVLYSPQTVYIRTAPVMSSSGFDAGQSRQAAAAPAYSGASSSAGVGTVAAPAAAAPAASTPNTGGGGDAGRRR